MKPKISIMNYYSNLLLRLILLFLIFSKPGFSQSAFHPVEPIIVWNSSAVGEDSVDQNAFQKSFKSIGLLPSQILLQDLSKTDFNPGMLIILPHASSSLLNINDIDRIHRAVENGARVITDGNSKFVDLLQLKLSVPSTVKIVKDLIYPTDLLHWADAPKVPLILNASDKSFRQIYCERSSGHPVGILKNSGKGMYLFLSALFDPISGEGYSRFPDLPNLVVKEMHCTPAFQRRGIDAYFDAGYRYDVPIKDLVTEWKSWGIKAVHAAAWDAYLSPPYDYNLLITEAHKQGILVYAWLEWPYIGKGFWDNHPEWREKNALLKDAQLDFLSLMDLQNPACMKKALDDLSGLMKDDWDGIDIAEFSITGGVAGALDGPSAPAYFTGFNDIARTEFKSLYGFDQADLFNKSSEHFWKKDSVGLYQFYKYRVQVNNLLLKQIISSLDSLKNVNKKDWEFIFTILDNSLHPEFDQLLGFDLTNTLKLAKEFHVTLQVEDPQSEWTRPPSRYNQLAKTYKGLVGKIPLAIDINIVPVHPINQIGFASQQPTGAELFRQYSFADDACGRVCFYAESSVYQHDWEVFPYVMASGTSVNINKNRWHIQTPHSVIIKNFTGQGNILLDGKLYPGYSREEIIIPKGEHILSFSDSAAGQSKKDNSLRLIGISDELIYCSRISNGIELV
ncbi:MAG: hypothetical protein P4L35_08685, partial [Ignavibacteriaceae bacterium]|nr:hypothetical protein [Ignavibacteriaceae bacterium]